MSDTIQSITFSLAAVLIVALICGTVTYGCVNTNQQYYAAMSACVSAGGSAVPSSHSGSGDSIVCIRK